MNKKQNISFIMPAYNAENTIRESIESIFNGNFESGDEVVVVNDSSTDSTKKVIKKLQRKYKQIKLISHSFNRGGGAARNTAVDNSNNSLIFCLDSDNILVPNSVRKLKKAIVQESVDGVCFGEVRYFQSVNGEISHSWIYSKDYYSFADYLSDFKVPGASGNYLYTKESYIKAGGYPEFTFLDTWGFGIRQVVANQKILTLKNSYYLHRIGLESYWVRESKKNNTSIQAAAIILPYIKNISILDRLYIYGYGLNRWFENIENRPIKPIR